MSRAREQVRTEGGGEVRVLDRAGRILESSTVSKRESSSKTQAGGRKAA